MTEVILRFGFGWNYNRICSDDQGTRKVGASSRRHLFLVSFLFAPTAAWLGSVVYENDNCEKYNDEYGAGGDVFGVGNRDAVYYGADSGSGKYAASDASAGAGLWICVRLEIRNDGWICGAAS